MFRFFWDKIRWNRRDRGAIKTSTQAPSAKKKRWMPDLFHIFDSKGLFYNNSRRLINDLWKNKSILSVLIGPQTRFCFDEKLFSKWDEEKSLRSFDCLSVFNYSISTNSGRGPLLWISWVSTHWPFLWLQKPRLISTLTLPKQGKNLYVLVNTCDHMLLLQLSRVEEVASYANSLVF